MLYKSAVIDVFVLSAEILYASAPAFIPAIVNWPSALYGFKIDDVYGLPSDNFTLQVLFSSGPAASVPGTINVYSGTPS